MNLRGRPQAQFYLLLPDHVGALLLAQHPGLVSLVEPFLVRQEILLGCFQLSAGEGFPGLGRGGLCPGRRSRLGRLCRRGLNVIKDVMGCEAPSSREFVEHYQVLQELQKGLDELLHRIHVERLSVSSLSSRR